MATDWRGGWVVTGPARLGRVTKVLAGRLHRGDIAVIDHRDLDELAGQALADAGAACVINAGLSVSGRYPSRGAQSLLGRGVPLVDAVGEGVFRALRDGERITVDLTSGCVLHRGATVARGRLMTPVDLRGLLAATEASLPAELDRFLENTLLHARREKDILLRPIPLPPLKTTISGRQVLVVVRGSGYRQDLLAVRPYIRELRPVLLAVDGGADALLEAGFRADLIVGDMDSVSDHALRSGGELVVHAYQDGRAPGLVRVRELGLMAHTFPVPGTSEDAAMLLAYEAGAELIVAVGTHTHVVDFLEKGRPGMASTMLTRLRVGSRLVDAKGLNQLYRARPSVRYVPHLVAAALAVTAVIAAAAPLTRGFLRIFWLQFRLMLGI